MKKNLNLRTRVLIIIGIVLASSLLIGCVREGVKPIETYGGSKYVLVRVEGTLGDNINLQLKNKDTIFWVTILRFDYGKLQVGDTIR